MSYLLDVNVLVSLGYRRHTFHRRATAWAGRKTLLTCSITELGFVRVLSSLPEADVSVAVCRRVLAAMKRDWGLRQIPDDRSATELAAWAVRSKQTTDAHLQGLAASVGAVLATFDKNIPDACLIFEG